MSVFSRFGRRVRTRNSLRDFTVQIQHIASRKTVGTGFVFQPEGKILTCAHVIRDATVESVVEPDIVVRVRFSRDQVPPSCNQEYTARVVQHFHQIHKNHYYDDVVIIELTDAPAELLKQEQMAQIEPAYERRRYDSTGNPFRSYGYSAIGYLSATYADGEIMGPAQGPNGINLRADPLQLKSVNIRKGMSGAALLDTSRDRVVGLITHQFNIETGLAGGDLAIGADAGIVIF